MSMTSVPCRSFGAPGHGGGSPSSQRRHRTESSASSRMSRAMSYQYLNRECVVAQSVPAARSSAKLVGATTTDHCDISSPTVPSQEAGSRGSSGSCQPWAWDCSRMTLRNSGSFSAHRAGPGTGPKVRGIWTEASKNGFDQIRYDLQCWKSSTNRSVRTWVPSARRSMEWSISRPDQREPGCLSQVMWMLRLHQRGCGRGSATPTSPADHPAGVRPGRCRCRCRSR